MINASRRQTKTPKRTQTKEKHVMEVHFIFLTKHDVDAKP